MHHARFFCPGRPGQTYLWPCLGTSTIVLGMAVDKLLGLGWCGIAVLPGWRGHYVKPAFAACGLVCGSCGRGGGQSALLASTSTSLECYMLNQGSNIYICFDWPCHERLTSACDEKSHAMMRMTTSEN
jgi:hypothetical protein